MAALFDLDGTLTDPKAGIVRCILHALDAMGVERPTEDLDWCIGPPLYGTFARILGTEEAASVAQAVGHFRERFSEVGLFENAVYAGIPECLARLREADVPLFVATSKPTVYAQRILDRFELTDYFERVYGSELCGRHSDKGELIAHLLETERPTSPIMIGDREHDVLGARKNGVPCIGVTYGYGSEEELDAAGAVALCDSPSAVAEAVLSLQATLALSCEGAR